MMDTEVVATRLTYLMELGRSDSEADLLKTMLEVGALTDHEAKETLLCAVIFLSCIPPMELIRIGDRARERMR